MKWNCGLISNCFIRNITTAVATLTMSPQLSPVHIRNVSFLAVSDSRQTEGSPKAPILLTEKLALYS